MVVQVSVAQQVCRELDDVDTPQALHDKIKEGVPVFMRAFVIGQKPGGGEGAGQQGMLVSRNGARQSGGFAY